jgi:hypothetical protein
MPIDNRIGDFKLNIAISEFDLLADTLDLIGVGFRGVGWDRRHGV